MAQALNKQLTNNPTGASGFNQLAQELQILCQQPELLVVNKAPLDAPLRPAAGPLEPPDFCQEKVALLDRRPIQ